MIDVRIERAGKYLRLAWQTAAGVRRTKGIGRADAITGARAEVLRRQKAAELHADPELATAETMTLAVWRTRFMGSVGAELAETTQAGLDGTFDKLDAFFGAGVRMSQITTGRAKDFRVWLGSNQWGGRPITLATIRKHVRHAKIIFGRAVVERGTTGVAANPFAHESGSVPSVDKDWAIIGDAEMTKILEACPDDGWRMLFALARWAGLRSNEARRLEWADIHWDHPCRIQIRLPLDRHGREAPESTKHRKRLVPIQPRLEGILREGFTRAGEGAVGPCDGLPIPAERLTEGARAILRRAGVDYGKPLHTLRKNLETEWARKYPLPIVTAWLGNSPAVALKHYVRAELADMDGVVGLPSADRVIHNAQQNVATTCNT